MSANRHVNMGTAYAPDAYSSVQDLRVRQMGTAWAQDAYGSVEDLRSMSGVRFIGGLREDDASLRLGGLREDDATVHLEGLREDDANVRLGEFLDQDNGSFDAQLGRRGGRFRGRGKKFGHRRFMRGLREDDADIMMAGLREDDADVRLSGLREDDAALRLGASDFHPRFPVKLEMKGLGSVTAGLSLGQIEGLFDFLKSLPTSSEWVGRLQSLKKSWDPLRTRIYRLSDQQRVAVLNAMVNMNADAGAYDRATTVYLAEASKIENDRVKRVERLEAALPSVEKLVAATEASAPAPTQTQQNQQAMTTVTRDVSARASGIESWGVKEYALAAGVGAGALGLGYVLLKALK